LDPLLLAELTERLFVHFTRGCWMAPLSDRLLPVLPLGPGRMGHLACGNAADVARARAALVPGRGQGLAQGLAQDYAALAPRLRPLRAYEGFDDPLDPPEVPAELPADLSGEGPLILLSAADVPLARLAGLLIAGAGRGMIWNPAPQAAASAHLLMAALGPRAGGGLALIQGDDDTGALLARQGRVIRLP